MTDGGWGVCLSGPLGLWWAVRSRPAPRVPLEALAWVPRAVTALLILVFFPSLSHTLAPLLVIPGITTYI